MCRRRTRRALGMLSSMVPIALALAGAGCTAAHAQAPAAAEQASPARASKPERTIRVVGQGEVSARPDVARVNLGVETTAHSVSEATAEATARMNAVLAALRELGISSRDLQTSSFSIRAERPTPLAGKAAAEGPLVYHVSNIVSIKVRDPDRTGAVLDAAVGAGANTVWGISFERSDEAALRAEARVRAVRDARARAESLAAAGEVHAGEILSIDETLNDRGGRRTVSFERAVSPAAPPIETGELGFVDQVEVVFAIAP
jgi:uncharacterized protein